MKFNKALTTLASLTIGLPLFANGLSDAITAQTVIKDEVPANTQNLNSNGREYKAADAQAQGNTGAGAAAATGAALVAAAIPLIVSLEPIQVAAGADLLAKAAMEFAQAGANSDSAAQNQAQNQLLTTNNASGETGAQTLAIPTAPSASSISSPALDEFLATQGVNANNFKSQLASGALSDPQAVLNALGNTTPISPEDFAAASALSAQVTGNVLQGTPGISEAAAIVFNEQSGSNTEGSSASESSDGGFASFTNQAAKDSAGPGMNSADAIKATVTGLPKNGKNSVATAKDTTGKSAAGAGGAFDPSKIINNLFGAPVKANPESTQALLRVGLEKIGVLVPTANQSIFQIARRNFYSFGKWRKNMRVAAIKR